MTSHYHFVSSDPSSWELRNGQIYYHSQTGKEYLASDIIIQKYGKFYSDSNFILKQSDNKSACVIFHKTEYFSCYLIHPSLDKTWFGKKGFCWKLMNGSKLCDTVGNYRDSIFFGDHYIALMTFDGMVDFFDVCTDKMIRHDKSQYSCVAMENLNDNYFVLKRAGYRGPFSTNNFYELYNIKKLTSDENYKPTIIEQTSNNGVLFDRMEGYIIINNIGYSYKQIEEA